MTLTKMIKISEYFIYDAVDLQIQINDKLKSHHEHDANKSQNYESQLLELHREIFHLRWNITIRNSKNYQRFDSLVFTVNKTGTRPVGLPARHMVCIRHTLTSSKCQTGRAALSYDVWLEVNLANIDGKHSFCTPWHWRCITICH